MAKRSGEDTSKLIKSFNAKTADFAQMMKAPFTVRCATTTG